MGLACIMVSIRILFAIIVCITYGLLVEHSSTQYSVFNGVNGLHHLNLDWFIANGSCKIVALYPQMAALCEALLPTPQHY